MSVAQAFDAIAGTYDDDFSNSLVGRAQRNSVWLDADRSFHPGQHVLEINCGTGIDALHLASRGVDVTACDSSQQMIAVARRRLEASPIRAKVDFRCIPTECIGVLENEGPFDGVLSNFAGLNCVSDLTATSRALARLVKPGGKAVLCLFGRVCLWEIGFYFSGGNLKKAFRRFSKHGIGASLGGSSKFTVHYPTVKLLRKTFRPHFRLESQRGVGILVPPSYLERLATRSPRFFKFAAAVDPWLGRYPGARAFSDHIVLTFERTGEP
jgi:ubiquinone/menaquinone biosynthesis C-methylase UbiE